MDFEAIATECSTLSQANTDRIELMRGPSKGARRDLLDAKMTGALEMPAVLAVPQQVVDGVVEFGRAHLPSDALKFDSPSCGPNAVQFNAACEALVTGLYEASDTTVAALREKQAGRAEHCWDEKHSSRSAFTGWDMLGLGVNVVIGGRPNEPLSLTAGD